MQKPENVFDPDGLSLEGQLSYAGAQKKYYGALTELYAQMRRVEREHENEIGAIIKAEAEKN